MSLCAAPSITKPNPVCYGHAPHPSLPVLKPHRGGIRLNARPCRLVVDHLVPGISMPHPLLFGFRLMSSPPLQADPPTCS